MAAGSSRQSTTQNYVPMPQRLLVTSRREFDSQAAVLVLRGIAANNDRQVRLLLKQHGGMQSRVRRSAITHVADLQRAPEADGEHVAAEASGEVGRGCKRIVA